MEEKKELLDQDERVVEIELERLRGFVNHPFKVQADSQMIELQESIKKYGILNPLIVRPRQDGTYEIISGHRRKYAAEKIGYRKVPVIIRVLKDDEAVVSMVDSNLQREMISPSEKAFAYKMKYEAIKRKAGRRKCGQVDHNLGKKSIELIGEECGDSPKQVQRYIKITELIPEMLEKVDDGSMGFTPAVQLSFLKKKEQKEMLDAMEFAQCTPSLSQALRIKKLSADGLSDKVSDKELIVALRSVCLYDSLVATVLDKNFVAADGIDKMVLDYAIGEGGTGLSGGEGQRLSLARVFLRRPKVFVFDESTTGLDGNTAEKVLFNIEEYAKNIGTGIIYISHDDRVVNRCKYVIKLVNQLKFANK